MAKEIVISASFSTDLLIPPLAFWTKEYHFISQYTLLPYNSIFQALLNHHSAFYTKPDAINILLFRTEDLTPSMYNELINALTTYQNTAKNPLFLILCPSSSDSDEGNFWSESVKSLSQVYFFNYRDIFQYYPLDDFFDPISNKNAHIPYKKIFFTVLTIFIVRKIHAMFKRPLKVVAVDCDNTLWCGVCAEVGAQHVDISDPFKKMQQFLLRLKNEGVLVTLVSHNSENDVLDVFKLNPAMQLKLEDLALWSINWEEKSNSIAALAHELNLSPNSFAFIDDNPVECQEVKAHLPAVSVFLLPNQIDLLTLHNWYFDQFKITGEATKRTQLYQENIKRVQAQKQSNSFSHFIASLDVKVTIHPLNASEIDRAEELLARTNQFNSTHVRLSTAELKDFLAQNDAGCLTVTVSDKFGEYGMVGLILYHVHNKQLIINNLLLSCRVLNRGVEFEIVNYIGELANNKNCQTVLFEFVPTERNIPIRNFLKKIAKRVGPDYLMTTISATTLKFNPEQFHIIETTSQVQPEKNDLPINTDLYVKIAELTANYHQLSQQIFSQSERVRISHSDPIEIQLTELWRKILKQVPRNSHVTFASMGGHSLQLLELLVEIQEQFNLELTLDQLFRADTIDSQSKLIMAQRSGN